MMKRLPYAVWLTWEHQRRSVELSRALGIRYVEIRSSWPSILRKLHFILKTIRLLCCEKFEIVFVQNPSNVLAALAALMKYIFHFRLLVDRHSNFIFSDADARRYSRLSITISNILSQFSLAVADLTVVSNEHLAKMVSDAGGTAFVLPDMLPDLSEGHQISLRGTWTIVFPCTFSPDEPLAEVILAASLLPDDVVIYVTGNFSKKDFHTGLSIPPNLVFTGFLPEAEYQSYVRSCDMIVALTTREYTLLCCAYEAVSLGRPLILSNKMELTRYFSKGSVVVENNGRAIANGIKICMERYENVQRDVLELRDELDESWRLRFSMFLDRIRLLEESRQNNIA